MGAQSSTKVAATNGAGRNAIRMVAMLEIWGALYGAWALSATWESGKQGNTRSLLTLGLIAAFYTLSLAAGLLLLRESPRGRNLSTLVQVPQLFRIGASGIAFSLYSGASVYVGMIGGALGATFDVGSGYQMELSNTTDTASFAVNVVAVLVLTALLRQPRDPIRRP